MKMKVNETKTKFLVSRAECQKTKGFMGFTKVLLSAACSVLLFAGCSVNNKAIVTVNGDAITKADYDKVMAVVEKNPQYQQAPAEQKKPDSPMMLMAKERIVQDLITRKLLDQEYKKRDISVTDSEIQAKKDDIIKQIGSKEKFDQLLKQNNVTEKQVNDDIANEIKVNKLIEKTANVKVGEQEVKDYYNQNKQNFNYPQRVKASHILIEANPEMIKKAIIDADKDGKLTAAQINDKVKEQLDKKMALAKDVRAQAAADPKKFAQLAKKYSDDKGSAVKGGDLGYFAKEAMVKEFSNAAFNLKPNTVSDVVVTQFGNHIIIVTDRSAAGIAPFEQVKGEIQAYLEQNKKIAALQNLFNGLKSSAKIEFNDPSYNPENIQKELRQGAPAQSAAPMTPAQTPAQAK